MKILKITTACATLALALSSCGSSTEATKTGEPSASAAETPTSESVQASASPTASMSEGSEADSTASKNTGLDPASIPVDMTVSQAKAKTIRPEKLGIYTLDSTREDPTSGSISDYEYFERQNPFTFAVMYRPTDDFEIMTKNLQEQVKVGNGICGIFTDTKVSRTISCYFPVVEGGTLKTSSTIFTDDPGLMDTHYQYIVRATADLANQVKD